MRLGDARRKMLRLGTGVDPAPEAVHRPAPEREEDVVDPARAGVDDARHGEVPLPAGDVGVVVLPAAEVKAGQEAVLPADEVDCGEQGRNHDKAGQNVPDLSELAFPHVFHARECSILPSGTQCWISPRNVGFHLVRLGRVPRDLLARHALYPRRPRRVALTRWLGTRSRATCWLNARKCPSGDTE